VRGEESPSGAGELKKGKKETMLHAIDKNLLKIAYGDIIYTLGASDYALNGVTAANVEAVYNKILDRGVIDFRHWTLKGLTNGTLKWTAADIERVVKNVTHLKDRDAA